MLRDHPSALVCLLGALGCTPPPTTASPANCPPCNCECSGGQRSSVASAPAPLQAAPDSQVPGERSLLERYEGKPAKRTLTGKATYYSNSLSGRKTASGEVYDPDAFTAAHKQLPFGTVVRVIRTDTNRYVYVRINDRGPFGKRERIIDLSYVAAERLGMIRAGVVPVRVEVLE